MADDAIGSAFVTLRADLKQLKADFAQAQTLTEKTAYGMEAVGKKIAGINTSTLKIGIAAAGAAVVAFGKVSLDAFIESENAIAKLNATLKATGDVTGIGSEGMQQLASDMQAVTGISDEVVMGAENILLSFTNISNADTFKDALTASANLAGRFGSIEGAALALGKAMDNPVEGMAALSRAGVRFTAEQKEQIKTMQESGNLMGAQSLILSEVEKKFGGAAEAAGKTFGGQLNVLKESFNDLQEVIGGLIAEFLAPFVKTLVQAVGGMKEFIETIAGIKPARTETDKMGESWARLGKEIENTKKYQSNFNEGSKDYVSYQGKIVSLQKQQSQLVQDYTKEVKKGGETQKKVGTANIVLIQDQIKAMEEYKKTTAEAYASIGTDAEKLTAKFRTEWGKIKGDSKEATDARKALEEKYAEDLKPILANEGEEYDKLRKQQIKLDQDWKENFLLGLEESSGASKTFFDQMGEAGAAAGAAIKGTLTNVFEDGLKGNLQTAQDYFNVFKDAVIKIIAEMAAEWVAKMALMQAATMGLTAAGVGGAAIGGATLGATTAGAAIGTHAIVGGSLVSTAAPATAAIAPAAGVGVGAMALGAAGVAAGVYVGGQLLESALGMGNGKAMTKADAEAEYAGWVARMGELGLPTEYFIELRKTSEGIKALKSLFTKEGANFRKVFQNEFDGDFIERQNMVTGLIGRPKLFANGGLVTQPTFALMGEAGDEAVMPISRGRNGKMGVQVNESAGKLAQVVLQIDGKTIASVLADLSRTGRLKLDRSVVLA